MTQRPFVSVTIFFMTGIIFEKFLNIGFLWLISSAILFFLLSLLFIKKKVISSIFISLFLICLGSILLKDHLSLPKDHINFASWRERQGLVEIEGVAVSDIQKRPYFKGWKTTFSLEVKRLKTPWGWRNRSGRIMVNVFRDCPVIFGDDLLLKGKL